MERRKIDIFYNINSKKLLKQSGHRLGSGQYPFIHYKEQVLVRLQLVIDDLLTPYTELASGVSYSCTLDNDYIHIDDPFIKTLNTDFNNIGDWKENGTADPTQGQLTFPLNAFTSIFQSNIGTNRQITNTNLELQLLDLGTSELVQVMAFDFYCKNIMDDSGTVPPSGDVSNYWTKTQSDAIYANISDVINLETLIDSNATDIATLSADVNLIDAFNVSADIDYLSGNIDTNITNIDINAVDIATLSADFESSTQSALSADIDYLSGNIDTNITNIDINAADIASLSADIITNETNINTNTTDVSNLSANVNDNNSLIQSVLFETIRDRMDITERFYEVPYNIDVTETCYIHLNDSPILELNYGFFADGNRIIYDNDLPYEDKDFINILYKPLTEEGFEDIINFTLEGTYNISDISFKCLAGESEDLTIKWDDGTTTVETIADTQTSYPHTYDSGFNGVKRNCFGACNWENIEKIWFDGTSNDIGLSWIGLSKVVNLVKLYLFNNSLTTINLEENTALEDLQLGNNGLKSIDLAGNVELQYLYLYENDLTELAINSLVDLEYLAVYDNRLTSLNISSNININYLDISNNAIPAGNSSGSESGTINHILKKLDDNGITNGYVNVQDMDPDVAPDSTLVSNLTAKSWVVIL